MNTEPVIIKNEYLTVNLSRTGAAVTEITDADGKVLCAGGDTVLFPVCGGVESNKISLLDMEYDMPDNGFARECEFDLLEYYEDYAQFILTSNDETVEKYPFSFNLIVSYKLLGSALEISCTVGNFSEYKMPYSFGVNTYLPILGKRAKAEFSNDEIFEGHMIENGLFSGNVKRLASDNGKNLNIKKGSDFILKNIISESVAVCSEKYRTVFSFDSGSNLYFGVLQNSLCVGVWDGFPDTFKKTSSFITKDNMNMLDENCTREFFFEIVFEKM